MAARDLTRPSTIFLVATVLVALAGCGGADHNAADVRFAQGMVPHHAQAVEMAEMALDRADDPAVRQLAVQVEAAQDPEIETMSDWLEEWGEDVPHADGHDHGAESHAEGMEGMMTPEDMDSLAQASGPAFDRLWLELMLEHHRGAISMAEAEQSDGRDPDAIGLAARIASTQQAEVDQMEELLAQQ